MEAMKAVNKYLGTRKRPSILKGKESANRDVLSALSSRQIILKINRQIFIPW